MDNKIFLNKYRVSAEEIGAVGEPADLPRAYEGEEIDSGKKVVVEVVSAGSLKVAVREQLEAEALAAKKLNHANIPALYDFGVEDDHLVYITEEFEGTLAEEWVNTHGPMPVGPVLRIAAQVVSAMGAAAFHRIVHHAINPSNLVLVPGQTAEGDWPLVKVLHFVGVAPNFSGADVSVAAFDKSLHYASPEQIQHGIVDFRSEVYSLGCTMWFLLTGAPPLTAPTGPAAVQPVQTGPAEEKMRAVPKKIRHLLAQMLSENPEARPRDPLAFYRKLQDCLEQVEQRETVAPKSRAPAFSPALADRTPRPPRNPLKALVRAALFLALAAFTAFVLRGYLQHRRVVRAEQPIGVPIGVPDTSASPPPVTANAANSSASNATNPTAVVAESNRTQSVPAKSAETDNTNVPTPATDSVETAATNELAVAPVQPTTLDSAATRTQSVPAKSAETDNANAPTPATDSVETAAISELAVAPVQPTTPDSAATPQTQEPSPVAANNATTLTLPASTDSPEVTIMREVRRAEPVEAEVRRAEPAPPEEGPVDRAPATTSQETNSVAKTEPNRDVEAESSETTSLVLKRIDLKPEVAPKSPARTTERPAKPKRTDEKIYMLPGREFEAPAGRLPRGSVRGRFMGVTADGRWMFELPSREIVIVAPPPSSP